MWQDKLKEIIYILENSDVNEIEVNFWGRKYRVTKSAGQVPTAPISAAPVAAAPAQPMVPVETPAAEPAQVSKSEASGEELLSPMPGTYYASPTPDDPPFVSEGDLVKKGQTLCIIEAMKIMNEIEAEFDGKVTQVKVKNGEPVEYNQPLFLIDPS